MKGHPVAFSRSVITELMVPSYANFGGKVHGGTLMSLMDKLAYVCASKHAGNYCVTVSVDNVQFLRPVEVGEVVSLIGASGSGKTTILRCINLSIDDFYLTHAERQELAATVHPLLATRGVPGTHDVGLAMDTINALKRQGTVAIPRFDKAVDDRQPHEQWPTVPAPLDVIVLEGWCLSVDAQPESALAVPVNDLESSEDCDGA
ncbi:MAG: hypothetical protein EBY45_06045, partial [Gammaproteobacteria bacterium]|nr:hypothetical protein [Gammaproteobacteria bacterium]